MSRGFVRFRGAFVFNSVPDDHFFIFGDVQQFGVASGLERTVARLNLVQTLGKLHSFIRRSFVAAADVLIKYVKSICFCWFSLSGKVKFNYVMQMSVPETTAINSNTVYWPIIFTNTNHEIK